MKEGEGVRVIFRLVCSVSEPAAASAANMWPIIRYDISCFKSFLLSQNSLLVDLVWVVLKKILRSLLYLIYVDNARLSIATTTNVYLSANEMRYSSANVKSYSFIRQFINWK